MLPPLPVTAIISIALWCLHPVAAAQSGRQARADDQRAHPAPGSSPILHISLIGDAGYAGPKNSAPIEAIASAAAGITLPEFTAYLGDNIYGNGMPRQEDKGRASAERVLDAQLEVFRKDTTMAGLFLPGNHDWDGMGMDGRASILRQSEYLRKATGSRIRLAPDSALPGPELVMRNDVLQIIALDSQWWLHEHDKPLYPGFPSDSSTRLAVTDSLHRLLSEFGGKVSIVLAHHPLETHGPHGGYFPVTDHIFPLRNFVSWLWLPLPVLGSAYPVIRAGGYSEQDATSDEYKAYIEAVGRVVNGAASRGNGPVFFASGHEHDLQVMQPKDDLYYLVSGNGILDHSTPLSDGPNTIFASETAGYMTLDVYDDGGVMLKVIGVESGESGPAVLFERWIPTRGD